jgi:hypothetical protein
LPKYFSIFMIRSFHRVFGCGSWAESVQTIIRSAARADTTLRVPGGTGRRVSKRSTELTPRAHDEAFDGLRILAFKFSPRIERARVFLGVESKGYFCYNHLRMSMIP